jgi:hypothetical protein
MVSSGGLKKQLGRQLDRLRLLLATQRQQARR